MALTRITKGVIKPNENYDTHNINSTGIVTAIGLDINGNGDISGNLSVGGVLTYEDVTSIDSVGIITAQKGIHVGAGVSAIGVGTFSGLDISGDIDVDGHTNLDNVSISGVTTATTINATTFVGNGDFVELDVDGHTNLDNTDIVGILTVTSTTQYGGYKLSNNSSIVAELVGLSGSNDSGALALWSGGSKYIQLSAVGNSYITGGSVGIGTNNPQTIVHISDNVPTIRFTDENSTGVPDCEIGGAGGNIDISADINSEKSDSVIRFNIDGGEKLQIDSSGRVIIGKVMTAGTGPYYDDISINNSNQSGSAGGAGITLISKSDNYGAIVFSNESQHERGYIKFEHNSGVNKLRFGTLGNDRWQIYSDGHLQPATDSTYDIGSNSVRVRNIYTDNLDVDGHTNLDNVSVAGVTTFSEDTKFIGATSGRDLQWDKSDNRLEFADNAKLSFGSASPWLQMYHSGSHAFITNTGGQLAIRCNTTLHLSTEQGYDHLLATKNADVKLYFDSANHPTPKLKTSATGIIVEGEVASSQDYPNFRPTLDLNFAAVKKLDPRITYYRTGPASFVNEFGKVVLVGDNAPRFDHDPTTRECKGLLMEVTRTNQMIYSSDITTDVSQNTGYSVSNGTVTGDQTTAPDGTTTADQFACDTSNNLHRVSIYFTSGQISNSTAYTFSVFVKANGYDKLHIRYGGYNADNHGLGYDLSDGTTFAGKFDGTSSLSAVTSSSMIAYPNGWYRCTFTFTTASDAASGSAGIFYYVSNSESTTNFAGDGSSGMYFWGAQMEVGNFPTSYIPTYGRIATRGNEHAVIDGEDFNDFYNTSESSVLAVGTMQRPAADQGQLNILHIGDDNEDGHGVFREHGTKDVWYHIRNGNSTPSGGNLNPSGFGDWDAGEEARIALAFKDGDQAISVNGGNQITAAVTSNYPTANITKMWIGSHGNGSYFEGHIQRIAYYPKQLTDNQLNTLTA